MATQTPMRSLSRSRSQSRGRSSSRGRTPQSKNNTTANKKQVAPSPQPAYDSALKQAHQKNKHKKLLNVTVTILSVAGVHVEDTSNKKSVLSKSFRNNNKSTAGQQSRINDGHPTQQSTVPQIRRGRSRSLSRGRSSSLVRSLSRGRSKSADRRNRGQSPSTNNINTQTQRRCVKIAPLTRSPNEITLVSSFERTSITKKGGPHKLVSHVNSLPLQLSTPTKSNSDKSKGINGALSSNEVVYWGSNNNNDATKSSFTFQRYFPYETTSSSSSSSTLASSNNNPQQRYVPQLVPLQISISRNNKLHKLGTAQVYINGEENGITSVNVPIQCVTAAKKTSRNSNDNNMTSIKIKGDSSFKCGVMNRATLRVVITVSDPTNSSMFSRLSKALAFENEDEEVMVDGDGKKSKERSVYEPSLLEFLSCGWCFT